MNISTYLIIIVAAVAFSTGSVNQVITHLAANPVPTWFALSLIIPMLLLGLLAIEKGNMDDEESRTESK